MIRLSCTAALLLGCFPVAADTLAPITVEAEELQEGDTPRVGDVVLEEYTGSHTRIERDQLQQAGASLGELLSFEAGIQHRQTGAEGSYSSVSIRGSTGAQTPVYWDGMLLNGAANPSVDLSDLELLNLGSVDIYRGSTPPQLGVGGMAGALNLRSPRESGQATTVKLNTGSFGSKALQWASSTTRKQWQLSGTLSMREAKNDFSLHNNNGTPLNLDDDRDEKRHNAHFERQALLGKLSYRENDSLSWDTTLQLSQRKQGVPEWRNNAGNQASYATDTTYLQLNRRNQNPEGSNWSTRLGVYQQWRRQRYDDRLSQVGLGAQLDKSAVDMSGITAYAEHLGEQGTLALNADLRHESLQKHNLLNGKHSEANRKSLELNTQYSRFSDDDRWLITPSLRLKSSKDQFKGVAFDDGNAQIIDNTGLQIGLRHQLNQHTSLRANIGQYHREPSFHELFGNEGLFIGNDELVAEDGINVDFSVVRSRHNGDIELSIFSNSRDDLITTVFNAQGIGRSINIGKARVQGLEFTATHLLPKDIELRFNASFLDSENQSKLSALHGKQLPGLARTDFYFRATKRTLNTAFWFETKALAGKFYDSVNLLPAADVVLHNMGITWHHRQWQSQASLNNISDERVQDYNGFDKPGRTAQFSVQYQF